MLPKKPYEYSSLTNYDKDYEESVADREQFWELCSKNLIWDKSYETILDEDLENGHFSWFINGKISGYDNISREFIENGKIYESFADGTLNEYKSTDVINAAKKFANYIKTKNIDPQKEGVVLFLPDSAEFIVSVLTLSIIGIRAVPVSIIYPAKFISSVYKNSESGLILINTSSNNQEYKKNIEILKENQSVELLDISQHIDLNSKDNIQDIESISMNSTDPLFLYYNSTGALIPKGYSYPVGGWLVQTKYSYKNIFHGDNDHNSTLIFDGTFSSIAGLAYGIWGPLLAGDSIVINMEKDQLDIKSLERLSSFPNSMLLVSPAKLSKLKNQLESSSFDKKFDKVVFYGDLVTPRLIDIVGTFLTLKPENVISLYIQRQTGSAIIHNLPNKKLFKAGSMGLPSFGITPFILSDSGDVIGINESGHLVFKYSWPGQANTIWNQPQRFKEIHFTRLRGYYSTGDGVRMDHDGFLWFMKRLDDVFKLDGLSISTNELEALLSGNEEIRESCVVGIEGGETGDSVIFFISPRHGDESHEHMEERLNNYIKDRIGEFALPARIIFMNELPRTGTGKIVRPVLHKIAMDDFTKHDDLSHVANPQSVIELLDEGVENE